MVRHSLRFLTLAALAALASCPKSAAPPATPPTDPEPTETPPTTTGPAVIEKSLADIGIDATAIDSSVKPCDDFYQYACGKWLERTQIPNDKARWSRGFDEIN